MMDRKSWLWKKKSSEKLSSAPDTPDSFQGYGSNQGDEQESEDKVKILNEQLSNALSDLATKEDLVKQHTKVAEEAVTGWEKAEAEAVDVRQKLDAALQQKLATEDRVLHLDGALKECMRQLRHVREEQEQRIHETVMKKTREWEKARTELDAKLADVGSQLIQAMVESNVMSKSLHERARTIVEVSEAKARADTEVKMLQVHLEAMEKENAKLNYEIHVLSKELEIRTEEREYNKKAGEAANKQHLENVKKIARLETECQRLRLLVRKRLPGPAALAQMRMEVEVLGKENGEINRRKSPYRRNASSPALPVDSMNDSFHDNMVREFEGLSDRVVAMEEENKVLKEVLVKRNNELQAARLMCARTAGKLSSVDEQLDSLSHTYGFPKPICTILEGHVEPLRPVGTSKEASLASVSEDGGTEDEVSCAESWASALMAELAHFKKETVPTTADKMLVSATLDLMDDFTEMERLASLATENHTNSQGVTEKIIEPVGGSTVNAKPEHITENRKNSDLFSAKKTEELESAARLCKVLRSKLVHAEEQLSALHERESKSGAILAHLKQHFFSILNAQVEGIGLSKVLEEVKSFLEQMEDCGSKQPFFAYAEDSSKSCLRNVTFDAEVALPRSPNCQAQQSDLRETTVISSATESKVCTVGPELADAVRKVLDLVEGLAQSDYSVPFPHLMLENATGSSFVPENINNHENADPGKEWKNLEFDASIQSLITLCQTLLLGKVDIIDFMAEMAAALDWLVGYVFSSPSKSALKTCMRQLNSGKLSPTNNDSEVASTADSLVFQPYKVYDDRARLKGSLVSNPEKHSLSDVFSGTTSHDEIQTILSERETPQAKLEAEIRRVASLESELLQLKSERDEAEQNYKLANEQLEDLRNHLEGLKHQLADVKAQLTTASEKKQSLESNFTDLLHAKKRVESELRDVSDDLKQLQKKAAVLQEELLEETKSRKEVETKLAESHQQQQLLRRSQSIVKENEPTSSGVPVDEESKLQKEREIASATEKLAECQQTIFVLGKQLKALGAPKDVVEASFGSSLDPTSIHKFCSSSDQNHQMHNAHESSDGSYHTGMEGPKASPGYGWSRNARDRKPEHGSTRGLRFNHHSGNVEADDPGQRGPNSSKYGGVPTYGRQVPVDTYKGNGFLSPVQGDHYEGPIVIPCSPSEQVVSSPGRSPARFLSLKNRNSGGQDISKHVNGGESASSSEKQHGTGFSRFFLRTRSGH